MMPVGLLMIEHRLIERMIKVMKCELEKMRSQNKANVVFIDTAIDFIMMYADKCHHGKEEDILFKELAAKQLSAGHKKILNELIQDHAHGRVTTNNLMIAKEKYTQGVKGALPDILKSIEELTVFYPKHIEKEDRHFFLPCMDYFSKEEQQNMLDEFWEFDKKLIHEKYKKVVEKSEE